MGWLVASPWLVLLPPLAMCLGAAALWWGGRARLTPVVGAAIVAMAVSSWALCRMLDEPDPARLGWGAAYLLSLLALPVPAARVLILRAGAVACIIGLAGWAAFLTLEPRIVNEDGRLPGLVVTGLVIAAGWIVTFAIQEFRAEQARRAEVAEIMTAFGAEIHDALKGAVVEGMTRSARGRDFSAKIREGGGQGPYHPFVPRPNVTVVFDAMSNRAHLLPQRTLFAIVTFYTLYRDIAAMSDDLNSDPFRAMPPDRRAEQFDQFVDLWCDADKSGVAALTQINEDLPWHMPRIEIPPIGEDSADGPAGSDSASAGDTSRPPPGG